VDGKVKNLLEAFTLEERARFYRAAERQALEAAREAASAAERKQALLQAERWRGLGEQAESSLKPPRR
jgi:hypothetical protein